MNYIVFDIETSNIFQDVGKNDPTLLDLSVVCIYNSHTDSYESFFEENLETLWPLLEETDALVGYNSNHFDIPLLNKYYEGSLFSFKSIDLMKTIQESLGRRIGLDAVASATLGTAKSANGLQAVEWWRQGEKQKVVDYCIQDVKVTKDLFDHMKEHQNIKYKDKVTGEILTVSVDVSEWDSKEETPITPTLQF